MIAVRKSLFLIIMNNILTYSANTASFIVFTISTATLVHHKTRFLCDSSLSMYVKILSQCCYLFK